MFGGWKVCRVYSFSGTKVPGTNGPRNESFRERTVQGTKVPSWEQMFQGTNSLENECSSIPLELFFKVRAHNHG